MSMFVLGLIVGGVVGASLGAVLVAVLTVSRQADEDATGGEYVEAAEMSVN